MADWRCSSSKEGGLERSGAALWLFGKMLVGLDCAVLTEAEESLASRSSAFASCLSFCASDKFWQFIRIIHAWNQIVVGVVKYLYDFPWGVCFIFHNTGGGGGGGVSGGMSVLF